MDPEAERINRGGHRKTIQLTSRSMESQSLRLEAENNRPLRVEGGGKNK